MLRSPIYSSVTSLSIHHSDRTRALSLALTLLSTTPRVVQFPGLHVLLVHPTALIISPTHRLLPQASLPPHPRSLAPPARASSYL